MQTLFEELDYWPTPIGAVSLRRRYEPTYRQEVYEIKLGDEFLMSSLFTVSEEALANLAMNALDGDKPDVIVGGLGLGYTARAVLDHDATGSLTVIEMLEPVIEWHRSGLLPLGKGLVADPRLRIVQGDFFALAASAEGFDPEHPGRKYDAILLDIDHSPDALLDARSTSFYRPDGLRAMARHLKPGGVFGLWSNERPDPAFTERLAGVFERAWAEPVTFDNPLQDRPFTQTVYLAHAS
jgi:spermidine synthase